MNTAEHNESAAFAIWITGLPASGKSTVAAQVVRQMRELGIPVTVLESDELRKNLPTNNSYDEQEREYFYSAMALIGRVLVEHGIAVIFDATANRRAYRDRARQQIARFIEVFVDSPLDTCIERDPKGIYRMAREKKASFVPGVQVPYEPPETPDVVIHGDREDPVDAARKIVAVLTQRFSWIRPAQRTS
jgi:adenylylsulfate kinase